MVTEGAFGKLKWPWRVLRKKCESNPETLKKFGLASIILHNISIEMGDYHSTKHWLDYRSQYQQIWVVLQMTDINQRYFDTNSAEVKSICDYLAERFWEKRQSYEEQ